MKKRTFLPLLMATAVFAACNNSGTTADNTSDTGNKMATDNTATPEVRSADTGTMSKGMGDSSHAMNNMNVDKMDKDFMMKAADGGMAEVEMGKMAQQMASNPRVKNFGEMMVNDHSKANDELKAMASSKGVTLPADISAEHKKHMDMLKGKTGAAFDKAYMNMMLTDHKKDISEFEKASKMCKDEQCKGWAGKTLPTLKMHLDSAQAISKMKM